jgi:hypothetical protein
MIKLPEVLVTCVNSETPERQRSTSVYLHGQGMELTIAGRHGKYKYRVPPVKGPDTSSIQKYRCLKL